MLTLTRGIGFIISSATAYLSWRGFGYISQLDGERGGLARSPKPHFTASLKPAGPAWSLLKQSSRSVSPFSFIIYVCGLRKKKKLMRGKGRHWGIQIASVWLRSYWPSMGTLFSLIYFQLLLLCLFMFFIALSFSLDIALSLSPFLYCSFSFFLAVCLFVSRSLFALWDLSYFLNNETDVNLNHLTGWD